MLPARSSMAGFACRTGALMLAHALFPDHTHHLLAWLAVPVAVADSLAVVASATPAGAQQALHRKAQQLKGRLQPQRSAGQGVGWVDGVQGVVDGSLHAFRALSGECGRSRQANCRPRPVLCWKGFLCMLAELAVMQCMCVRVCVHAGCVGPVCHRAAVAVTGVQKE